MHAFTFRWGGVPWSAGVRLLHVYVTADLAGSPQLAALIGSCRAVTHGEPLAHVGDDWLHITLCQIAVPAREVSVSQRVALAAEIDQALRATEPFAVMVGDPFRASAGILLGISDGGRLSEVRALVSSAADAVLGVGMAVGNSGQLHMTESYACADAADAVIDDLLEDVHPRQAPLVIEAVDLVNVSADQEAKTITWDPVARLRLGS